MVSRNVDRHPSRLALPTPAMTSKRISSPKAPDYSLTLFQRRVYDNVSKVPPGRFTTYKALADAIRCPSPRAVAQALRRNPFAPTVPCHRVLRSDFHIGGYKGETDPNSASILEKKALLASEGIIFDSDNYVSSFQRSEKHLMDWRIS